MYISKTISAVWPYPSARVLLKPGPWMSKHGSGVTLATPPTLVSMVTIDHVTGNLTLFLTLELREDVLQCSTKTIVTRKYWCLRGGHIREICAKYRSQWGEMICVCMIYVCSVRWWYCIGETCGLCERDASIV